jgi:ubiquinone/menaquinone biosynthesis C-methylase UbiE
MSRDVVQNADSRTVEGFGDEWSRFDQRAMSAEETQRLFDAYFDVFPWSSLPPNAEGMDVGCGSGRWARLVAPRVGRLHCIDASAEALAVAGRNLSGTANVQLHHATVAELPVADGSLDFAYSLGVLHHVPDTAAGIAACVRKLKPGAPFLLYLYYAFDNRPAWYRAVWRASDGARRVISSLPMSLRYAASQVLAGAVYYPLARGASLLEKVGAPVEHIPLSAYRDRSFYAMRTDALDRFGTSLEQRFTRLQIAEMMRRAGLERVRFSERVPYWVAVGHKSPTPVA